MCRLHLLAVGVLVLGGLTGGPARAEDPPADHPFALVNVIDLYDLHTVDPSIILTGFDTNNPPSNWATYLASPRIGSNPGAIAVHGNRLWVAGYCNGRTYANGYLFEGWYESLGIAEVGNILTISGYGAPYVRYPDSFLVGPTVCSTDSFTGIHYDPFLQRLYATYDDTQDISFFSYPSGAPPQVGSFVAAYDADPASPTYAGELWYIEDPIFPPSGPFAPGLDRFYGGIAADPFTGRWLMIPRTGLDGPFLQVDAFNPSIDPDDAGQFFNVTDEHIRAEVCPSTWYRAVAFHPLTGDMYLRNSNAVARIFRRPGALDGPFQTTARFIREPAAGGNGLVDTVPMGDDVYLNGLTLGAVVEAGQNIIAVGPDGVLTTVPTADDEFSPLEIEADRPVGNIANNVGDNCDDGDPATGLPNGPFAQGQNIAVVSAHNLAGYEQDLLVANSRPRFGSGLPKDVRVYTVDGGLVSQLELPCSPPADDGNPNTTEGIAYYDIDYDAESGTLVVVEFEQRKVYVFKANTTGSNLRYTRYDWDRNGRTDLADFAALQRCYTGAENTLGLSLACQRMNTDSDCDIDYDDFVVFTSYWTYFGGP